MNDLILDILKRKITSGELTVDDIKNAEYKSAIQAWMAE